MRYACLLLHRWVGLAIAGFLFVSGLTGAIISWDHELDEVLNAHLVTASATGPALESLKLAQLVAERDRRVRVTYIPLGVEQGHSLSILVEPRVDPATAKLYEVGYNQVFIDPAKGHEIGRREWGAAWPITSETIVSFLYKLHYSLHIPEMWGIDSWGIWLMGGIALLWTVDCFIGFYLTLPQQRRVRATTPSSVKQQIERGYFRRWQPAWQIKKSGSRYRLNFDIHRAFGLWTWLLLFVLAFTAFSLNLYRDVFYPLMSMVSTVTPTPFDQRTPADKTRPIEPKITFEDTLAVAQQEAQRRGWSEPVGALAYFSGFGIYGVRFFHPGDDHGAGGVGPAELYFDGLDGRYLGDRRPWQGTAADIFVQAQFPLHSGRILGLPGRILVSIMGLVVAALSVTGIIIWWRKSTSRRGRVLRANNDHRTTDYVAGE